jgi:hypothetical protein
METSREGYKRKRAEDIPRRREGTMVILHLSDRYRLTIFMSQNFGCCLCVGEQQKCNGEREICILLNFRFYI